MTMETVARMLSLLTLGSSIDYSFSFAFSTVHQIWERETGFNRVNMHF